MQKSLDRAAKELGIRIVVGYVAHLSDGTAFCTQALFPDFGSAFGTIVLDIESELDTSIRKDLLEQGFSISTFSEPLPNEEFDALNYAEMFSEWGWTNNEMDKPAWM